MDELFQPATEHAMPEPSAHPTDDVPATSTPPRVGRARPGEPESSPARADAWAAAEAYGPFMGRWSALVARKLVEWLAPQRGMRWLDVGCGTGALTQAILACAEPAEVIGIDPSDHYLAYARRQHVDRPARFTTGDAEALPVDDASQDAVVSGLVLNFVPSPARAAAEMRRVVRPGGTVAGYVWDYAGRMQLLRHFWDAAGALDPAARALDEAVRFPLCTVQRLRDLLVHAGLVEIDCRVFEVPTAFRNFDDLWSPFLGGQGPAPTYCGRLTEEQRAALRERLRTTLPDAADGTINLVARAFAVRGLRLD
jgi:SAM-dependent methyltransferase